MALHDNGDWMDTKALNVNSNSNCFPKYNIKKANKFCKINHVSRIASIRTIEISSLCKQFEV